MSIGIAFRSNRWDSGMTITLDSAFYFPLCKKPIPPRGSAHHEMFNFTLHPQMQVRRKLKNHQDEPSPTSPPAGRHNSFVLTENADRPDAKPATRSPSIAHQIMAGSNREHELWHQYYPHPVRDPFGRYNQDERKARKDTRRTSQPYAVCHSIDHQVKSCGQDPPQGNLTAMYH